MSPQQHETRSTAYVFGELSTEENAQFERELEQSTELQSEVASIREAVVALEAEFDAQATGVNTEGREKIEQAMSGGATSAGAGSHATELNKPEGRTGRRRLFFVLATAASLMIIVGLVYPRLPGLSTDQDVRLSQVNESAAAMADAEEYEEMEAAGSSEDGSSVGGGTARIRRSMSSLKPADELAPKDSVDKSAAGQKRDSRSVVTASSELKAAAQAASASPVPTQTAPAATNSLARRNSTRADAERQKRSSSAQPQFAAEAPVVREAKKEAPDPASLAMSDAPASPAPGSVAPAPAPAPTAPARQQPHPFGAPNTRLQQKAKSIAPESRFRAVRGLASGEELREMNESRSDADQGIGPQQGGDRHDVIEDNPFREVDNAPLSTFSIDVDTAAYSKVRMYLMQQNSMPRPDAVRIEEMVNYFTYDYAPPTDEHPFSASMEVAACPWNAKHRLARIGIKGKVIEEDRPSSNLVFLLDVSGSMTRANKLPLVIEGMKMLVNQLTENDSVAIVVYAGAAGLVLDSTTGDQKQTIIESLERLRAGGSTNGGQGITLAYQIARDNFISGGTNRVILCSDGDFNVGVTGTDELVRIAQENAKGNIFLSVLGFGMGNHNDSMMEQVSNKGNGNYAFIDSKAEAQKVLVEEMGSTLVTIAKDVKIQVEFNPEQVSAYRLIGYENRMLAAEDFNDDTKDAGEIGAGHTVTALYELVPGDVESELTIPAVDDLRYQKKAKLTEVAKSGELLVLKLRYKQPEGTKSTLIEFPVKDSGESFTKMDQDFQFAASVAAFGMLLRNSPHKGDATYAAVEEIAGGGISNDPGGYRSEFLRMVARAKELSGE